MIYRATDTNPRGGLGVSRLELIALYPRLGDLLVRTEAAFARAWESQPGFLSRAAQDVLSGRGKRLRPVTLLLSADCAGGATDDSIAMASLVEIMHVASLIHDDVIDDALSRHGRRSAKDRWGNKVSVLLGDYLIASALNLLPSDDGHGYTVGLSRVAARMCSGQIDELRAAGRRLTETECLDIVLAKTGSLFSYACQCGAETAGATPELANAFAAFGESFGVAFQLADDVLDLVGTNGRSGKSEGRDLAEGKWTLPLILAYHHAGDEARADLTALLGPGGVSPAARDTAREIVHATGAVDLCWTRVNESLAAARRHLAPIPDSEAKRALLALAGDRFPMPVMT
jgi:octaprenyl-diphosphate synthase